MRISRNLRTTVLAVSAAASMAVATILPASAHIGATPTSTAAGSTSIITFGVGHGCDGAATTSLTFQIPDEITTVKPVQSALWDIEIVNEDLATPVVDSHGAEVTTRVSEVVFTAKEPLPDAFYDSVSLRVGLPDAAGETIYFPVIQSCETGENAWINIPASEDDEVDSPAPAITITEATESGH